jgi:hypothetical protein
MAASHGLIKSVGSTQTPPVVPPDPVPACGIIPSARQLMPSTQVWLSKNVDFLHSVHSPAELDGPKKQVRHVREHLHAPPLGRIATRLAASPNGSPDLHLNGRAQKRPLLFWPNCAISAGHSLLSTHSPSNKYVFFLQRLQKPVLALHSWQFESPTQPPLVGVLSGAHALQTAGQTRANVPSSRALPHCATSIV